MIALLLSFWLLAATAAPTAHTSTFASDFIPAMGAEVINDNCVWSPVSVENILALLYFGADHETAAELKSILKANGTKKDLAAKIGSSHQIARSGGPSVNIADRFYVDKRLHLKKEYVALATKAQIRTVSFEGEANKIQEVNTWLQKETDDKIHNMISKFNTDWEAGAVVVNEIHFKANWVNHFLLKERHPTYKYQMIITEDIMLYAALRDLNAYAALLKLQGTNVSMLVLLPKDRENGLGNLEEKLKNVDLTQLPKAMKDTRVTLMMPKFKVEFDTPLKSTLQQLGLNHLFNRPDFSELLEDDTKLDVTEIRHKSYIEVTEEGIEAASSTGVEVHPPGGKHNGRPNRQFFFALIDERNVYFAGHIAHI